MEQQGSVIAVQMSGAGPGHAAQQQPAHTAEGPAPSSNTPAKATIHKQTKVAITESGEHTSPMAGRTGGVGRKRRLQDEGQAAVDIGDAAENLTAINTTNRMEAAPQPSGRGEVGGSTAPGEFVVHSSRLGSFAVPTTAMSNLAASVVHVPEAAPQDSGSNQPAVAGVFAEVQKRGGRVHSKVRRATWELEKELLSSL